MDSSLRGLGHQLRFLQTPLDPSVAARATLTFIPTVKVLDVPAVMPRSILRVQRHHFIDRRAPIRDLFKPPVNQALQSVRLILRQITPETALAHSQHQARLGLRQPSCIPLPIRLYKSHLPYLL